MVMTQLNLYKNICFYKYAHNSGPKVSPGMILQAFHCLKEWDTSQTNPHNLKTNQNMHQEMGPAPARPPERAVQGAQLPWNKKEV